MVAVALQLGWVSVSDWRWDPARAWASEWKEEQTARLRGR